MPPGQHLDQGEQVNRIVYRSLISIMPVFFSAGFIVLVTLAGLISWPKISAQMNIIPGSLVALIALVLVLVAFLMVVSAVFVYRRNCLVISNMHVTKHEQVGLFNQKMAQLELSRVQDVTGSRHGLMGTLFNYGDVEIETAGAQENFVFSTVPGPETLADQLLEYHEQFVRANPGRELP